MQTVDTTLQPGNWKSFDSFVWFGRPEDGDEFALVYTRNRDTSDPLDLSNARVIDAALAEFIDSGDVIPESHSHWACGWVEGYAIRVYRADGSGELTPVAQVWDELQARMADYPILDESDLSDLETELQGEAWDNWARHEFERELERVFGQFLDGADLDASADQLGELFYALRERSNTDWDSDSSGVSIDVARIVESATTDDVAEYIPARALRLFINGAYLADGETHCGVCVSLLPLYEPEFERVADAIERGDESATLDNGDVITWTIR